MYVLGVNELEGAKYAAERELETIKQRMQQDVESVRSRLTKELEDTRKYVRFNVFLLLGGETVKRAYNVL